MLPGKPDSVEAVIPGCYRPKKENVKNIMERGKEMEKRRINERGKSWKEEKKEVSRVKESLR